MMKQEAKLESITTLISQGIQPGRVLDPRGVSCRLITPRNLGGVLVDGEPTEESLRDGSFEQYLLQEGDVLILNRGGSLKPAMVTADYAGTVAGQNLVLLRPGAQLEPLYLVALLRAPTMKRSLVKLFTAGTTMPMLNVSRLRELVVPLPDLETQRKVALLLEEHERYVAATTKALQARAELVEVALGHVIGGVK